MQSVNFCERFDELVLRLKEHSYITSVFETPLNRKSDPKLVDNDHSDVVQIKPGCLRKKRSTNDAERI